MSNGILIENTSGRIQIDENYSNFYPVSTTETSAAVRDAFPPPNHQASDLIVARAKSSGHLSAGSEWYGPVYGGTNYPAPSSGYGYYVLRKFSDNVPPKTSGYGMEVYNSGGKVVFSVDEFGANFNILATGNWAYGGINGPYELAFPSATTTYPDLTKIYVLANNTTRIDLYVPFFSLDYEEFIGYRYEFVSGNSGRVWLVQGRGDGSIKQRTNAEYNPYLILEKEE